FKEALMKGLRSLETGRKTPTSPSDPVEFERRLINQGGEERAIEETLDTGWGVLGGIPEVEYRRIRKELIKRYHRPAPLTDAPAAGPAPGSGSGASAGPAAPKT
ncbi:MAG: hypothetical protein ACHQ1F_08675, partial [Spirochaetia bacterium]